MAVCGRGDTGCRLYLQLADIEEIDQRIFHLFLISIHIDILYCSLAKAAHFGYSTEDSLSVLCGYQKPYYCG